ncbi:hypothetical protein WA026_003473 [Henosepilachna vigintioctopunctata]|uniref:Uncharacterized protein n=1 Tax=Henosepilachna vigintioctopunctata TaxID=420089 RepID=A0AAW1TN39_9CUCU
MTTNNNNNSYVAGFKVNYSSDTDNSSNSVRSSNASLLTSIQLIDLKNISNDNEKLKNKYGYVEKSEDSGYFKRLKFSTSSLLKRNKNSNTLVKPQAEKCSLELSNNTDPIQDKKSHNLNYRKFSILKPSDGHFFSFLKSKKEKPQTDNNTDTGASTTEYAFLDKMGIAERCRISIECKNNSISIEGHRKCS